MSSTALRFQNMPPLKTYSVVELAGIAYQVGNRVEWSIPADCGTVNVNTITTAVVFSGTNLRSGSDGLEHAFSCFERDDDVFQTAFTEGSLLIAKTDKAGGPTQTLSESAARFLDERSSKLILATADDDALPDGPAWRLYADENLAFTLPVIPSEDQDQYTFESLRAGAYSGLYPVVAVPSRLYFPVRTSKPLNGLRVTIKDNYHLRGVQTTLGSRSYTKLYGPQPETARVVQDLIDQGAVMIGKTKMGAYAASEVPPQKCVDYFPPWNPRRDGYQGPSGSSSGAGSSVASYDWVDVALGTDSTGSIRMPAASYGLWGLRATHGLFPLTNVVPNVERFDTLGILARSPVQIQKILAASRPPVTATGLRRPAHIIYPTDWFPMKDESQQRMVSQFLQVLEEKLGRKVLKISLQDAWSQTGPEGLKSKTLEKYLDKSIYWPNYFDGFHSYDQSRADHKKQFGYKPYTSPFMTKRWGLADAITKEQKDQGLTELTVYGDWVREQILKPDTEYNFVLLPLGRAGANFRDKVPVPGGEFSESAYDPMDFCTVLGLPQLVVPIGQNPYDSPITDTVEYAPIVASLAGPQGSDEALLQLAVKALNVARWPTSVLTGKSSFRVGNNDRNAVDGADEVRKI